MGKDKLNLNIDVNKLLERIRNMEQEETNQILKMANYLYNCIDIPVIILDDEEIKLNTVLIAMYLVGKEIGKNEQKQDK